MSFHGVQIDKPSPNERPMENTVFQMIHQRKVSRKNKISSIRYMIVNVKAA